MKTIYEQTDKLRLELAIQTERETNLIKRRNELELHLKNVKKYLINLTKCLIILKWLMIYYQEN